MKRIALSNKRGFTLIELLVVIAIIGILASVVMISLNTARAKGRDTKRVAELKQMQIALESYFVDNGNYPSTGGNWAGTSTGCYGGNGSAYLQPLVAGGYMQQIPEDPSPVGDRCYLYRSDGTNYMFLAHGTIESFNPYSPLHAMRRQGWTGAPSLAVYSDGAINW